MHLSICFLLLVFINVVSAYDSHCLRLPTHSTHDALATSQFAYLNTIPSASLIIGRRTFYHLGYLCTNSICCLILLSGDIETNPGPTPACFNICKLNIQSLTDAINSTAVADLAQQHNLDLIALSETWIKPETTPCQLSETTPPGYTLLSKHRPLPANYNPKYNLGGGLAFIIKEDITLISSASSSNTAFESFSTTVKLSHGNLTVFNIYRPPSDSKHANTFSVFLDEFQSFLEHAATKPHEFIITGDFNIHVNKSDRQSIQFLDLLHTYRTISTNMSHFLPTGLEIRLISSSHHQLPLSPLSCPLIQSVLLITSLSSPDSTCLFQILHLFLCAPSVVSDSDLSTLKSSCLTFHQSHSSPIHLPLSLI